MITINVTTTQRRQMIDISSEIGHAIGELQIDDGLCHIHVPHTTGAIVINENADPDVQRDLLAAYEQIIPSIRFAHREGNSDAHFLSTLLGSSQTVPVKDGRLRLGTWQGIYFVELDGPRQRKVWISGIPAPA